MTPEPHDHADGRAAWRQRLRSIESAALAGLVCALGWTLAFRGLLASPGLDATRRELVRYYADPANGTAAVAWLQVVVLSTIAFLWFVGVVRARIGEQRWRLPGTVFFGGSVLLAGLMFVGTSLLAAPGVMAALSDQTPDPGAAAMLRAAAAVVLSIFLPRIATLLMFSTAILGRASGALPTWLVVVTGLVGVFELVNVTVSTPSLYVLPAWIATVSVVLLVRHPVGAFRPASADV